MSEDTWDALRATPIRETRRRAAVISEFVGIEPQLTHGAERLAWADFGGQAAVWFFTPDGRVLLLTFDHESDLNLYDDELHAAQRSLYDGVPEDLVRLVRNPPDNHELPDTKDPETGETLQCAGGVFWFDGEQWRPAEGMLDYCDQEGIDPRESGFEYAVSDYLFGQEFTPEAFAARRDGFGFYNGDPDRRGRDITQLGEIIARHP